MIDFNHMFIHNLDPVDYLPVIHYYLKELRRVCTCGDLGLVWTLSKLPPEGIEHEGT